MKKALVIGVTGGFGEHVAAALLDKGWHVKALVRDPAKRAGLARGIKVVHGDARRIEDVRRAADGVDVLV
ncbi:MAG: NAD-dependent epimerase/dehydratase family protein, partial [Proteobacteria bacterium]